MTRATPVDVGDNVKRSLRSHIKVEQEPQQVSSSPPTTPTPRRSRRASLRVTQALSSSAAVDVEDNNGIGNEDRRSIRKKQNRDSARRCRLKRKMQTADIFDLLRDQNDMIVKLSAKVEELGSAIYHTQTCMVGGVVVKDEVGGGGGLVTTTNLAGNDMDIASSPMSSAVRSSHAGRSQNENSTTRDHTPSTTQSDLQGQGQDEAGVRTSDNDENKEVVGGVSGRKGAEDPYNGEGVLQFDGMHLPDLGFLDDFPPEQD